MGKLNDPQDQPPVDAWVIALDATEYWCIASEDAPWIDRIYSVYMIDRNERTHLCEYTPSNFCRFLYHRVELKGPEPVPDDVLDRINQRYELESADDTYTHVSTVQAFIGEHGEDKERVHHCGAVQVDPPNQNRRDEIMEELYEHSCCNPPL